MGDEGFEHTSNAMAKTAISQEGGAQSGARENNVAVDDAQKPTRPDKLLSRLLTIWSELSKADRLRLLQAAQDLVHD